MFLIKFDINPDTFQKQLLCSIEKNSFQYSLKYISKIISDEVVEQYKQRLEETLFSQDILQLKRIKTGGMVMYGWGYPKSLKDILNEDWFDVETCTIDLVSSLNYKEEIKLESPTYLSWERPLQKWDDFMREYVTLKPPVIDEKSLKNNNKYSILLWYISLPTKYLIPIKKYFPAPCDCSSIFLLPYLDRGFPWALTFICKICGKIYFCECFKKAFELKYAEACKLFEHYSEEGWPYKFAKIYKLAQYRKNLCYLCNGIESDLNYCHPMYGGNIVARYGPWIIRTSIEKGIDHREAENEIRDLLGIPHIGEGWISEMELFNLVKEIFPKEKVIHQARLDWLGLQSLDIYIPSLKLAIEYQGRQHYEPVDFFGGKEGLVITQKRDKLKAKKCKENRVYLIYFRYDEEITKKFVKQKIKA